MSLSSLFITDSKGKILISRNYRGEFDTSAIDAFAKKLEKAFLATNSPFSTTNSLDVIEDYEIEPIFKEKEMIFINIKRNDLYIVTVVNSSLSPITNISSILLGLDKLYEIFYNYFGSLTQEKIRDNFVLIYELFDEILDYGYLQNTDSASLKQYIIQKLNIFSVTLDLDKDKKMKHFFQKSKNLPKLPSTLTNKINWRASEVKHSKNEVFLDVIEYLSLLISKKGKVLNYEIFGKIKIKSYLSGMPELKLGLNDKILYKLKNKKGKSVTLEDLKFHQCVQLNKFNKDRTISFIPPDGPFTLLNYRIKKNIPSDNENINNQREGSSSGSDEVKPLIWVEVLVESYESSRLEMLVKTKSQFKSKSAANNVKIYIPVPNDVDTPSFKANIGSVTYTPDQDCIVWKIKKFHGGREFLMRAHFGRPTTIIDHNWKKPSRVEFEIPYFTVSGLQVRYLKIVDKSGYQALPWVRYITENGDYQLRMT